jgi:hypothetical protein
MRLTTREQITPSVTAPPPFTNVAAPNSGHAQSPLQVCDDLLRQIPRNSVFAAGASSRPKIRLPILLWTKNEPRRGSTPARAAQGMATTSCCGKSCLRRTERFPSRTVDSNHRAALANDYCPDFVPLCGLWVMLPPLASLVGLRSRTSTCGLSFFSSLILPFSLSVVFLVLGCVSRAEIFAPAYDLLVWDQVVQTDQLIFRTLLPLSSTLPRICVLFFLRRTHMRPITTICAMRFLLPIFFAIRSFYSISNDLFSSLLYS